MAAKVLQELTRLNNNEKNSNRFLSTLARLMTILLPVYYQQRWCYQHDT